MPIEYTNQDKEGVLYRDGESKHQSNEIYNWMLRRYFPEEVERLKGDADKIGFHKIVFRSGEWPEVEYSTWNEI